MTFACEASAAAVSIICTRSHELCGAGGLSEIDHGLLPLLSDAKRNADEAQRESPKVFSDTQ